MPRRSKIVQDQAIPEQGSVPDFSSFPIISDAAAKKIKNDKLKTKLEKIYSEVQNDPHITIPTKKRSFVKFVFWFLLIIIIIIAAGWAGYSYLTGQSNSFSDKKIQLTIDAPDKISSSNIITYKINYKNTNSLPIGASSISVRYPDEFKFISATPTPTGKDNLSWDIGTLDGNQSGVIEISGQIYGQADTDVTLRTFLDYRPANFNSDFQKINNFITHLNPLPLDLTINGPDELTAGSASKFYISALNTSEQKISDMEINLLIPTGLKIISSNLKPTDNSLLWKMDSIKPATSSTIELVVVAASDMLPGDQTIKAFLNAKQNNKIYLQKTAEKNIRISKPNLLLQIAANGATDKQAVNFGDKVNLSVSYENTGDLSLKNVTLRLIADAPALEGKSLLDWANLQDAADGTVTGVTQTSNMRRGIITWTKKEIPSLAEIKPHDKKTIELSIPLKNKTTLDATKLSQAITTIYVEAITDTTQAALQSNNISLILNSDLNLTAQATLKDTKSLPISIGKTFDTKNIYSINWTVTNSLHELADIQITATLPENVDWEKNSSSSAGDITYDATTKQISWKLNRLPQTAGKVTINFDVGLKSKESDAGNGAALLEKTRIEAKDNVTNENMLIFKDPILTVL